MSTLPLILSEEPVTRGLLSRMKVSKPNIAVVYSDAFGRITYLGGRPLSWSEQVASKYRIRYEVDLSDHRRTGVLQSSPLPSSGDRYYFQCTVDVGLRVTDPAAVVQRHVTDALAIVYNYIIDTSRPVTRRYDIKDAQAAEAEINYLFAAPVALPEGITIYHCRVRLLPDLAAQAYLQSLEMAVRTKTVDAAVHDVAVANAYQSAELEEIAQRARLGRERLELLEMAGRPVDLHSIIQMHLAKHPDETAYVLDLLRQHEQAQLAGRETRDQRTVELFRYMIEQDVMRAVDVAPLREQMISKVQGIAGGTGQAQLPAGSWDEPLPARVVPVYVVIDESVADQGYFEVLNRGMQRLPSELSSDPETSGAIRLAAIGYGSDVALRMPLRTITAESAVPGFSHRDSGSLGRVFEYLRNRIPEDVDRLKGQGLTLGRPTLHLLCGAPVNQDFGWEGAHHQLTDRSAFSYAPNIIACGLDGASPSAVRRIATQPGSAWIAPSGLPMAEATTQYLVFVRATIINLVRAHAASSTEMGAAGPAGFRLADGP
ncbi:MAG TPA: hypothetical protein VKS82_02455 [Streptosporangiaceae bacterium]|nr:hypothetical protein [Streptosporangiaceae bacterium]